MRQAEPESPRKKKRRSLERKTGILAQLAELDAQAEERREISDPSTTVPTP